MSATPEVFPVINADGVTIVTPPGVSYEEARRLAKAKADLLEAQYGSRDAIPAGEYNSQEGVIDTPTGDEPYFPGKYAGTAFEGLKRGTRGLVSAVDTAFDTGFNLGIFRDPVTDEDIKAKQLVMQQEALEEANISGPRVQFMDILGEWNRQDLLDELNYENLPEEEKQKSRESLSGFDLDAPEKSITDMVARWAIGGMTESVPWMAPQLAGGYTAMRTVPDQLSKIPVVGKRIEPVAKAAAFAVGATIAGVPQFYGSNLERSIQEGKLTEEELNKPGGFAASIAQSASDSLFYAIIGRYGGPIQKSTATDVLKNIAKGAAVGGATEVPTEIVQQALERLQAGLPISPSDEEALREYIEAGALALVAGGTLGGGVSGIQSATADKPEGPSFAFSDPADMSGTLSRVRNAEIQEKIEFTLDLPEGPVPIIDTVETEQKSGIDLDELEEQAFSLMEDGPVTISNIQQKFKVGFNPTVDALNRLVDKGLIKETSSEKQGISKFEKTEQKTQQEVIEQIDQETGPRKNLAPNNIKVRPSDKINIDQNTQRAYPFDSLPEDATVRLFYGSLQQQETTNADGEPQTETVALPLVDPETGQKVFKDYKVSEFILPGETEPNSRLLNKMEVELDGTVYKPIWDSIKDIEGRNINSFALIPMGTGPQMRVERKRSGPLNLLNILRKNTTNLNAVPDTATQAEINEQEEAKSYLKYILHNKGRALTPKGALPYDEFETLNKQKWLNRGQLREAQDIDKRMQLALKKAVKLQETVNKQIEFKKGTMELLESYWSSSDQVNLQDLQKLGHDQEFIDNAVELRNIVNTNSKKIISLLESLDPEGKKYSKELRQVIQERLGSYMTQAYSLHTDPSFKAPNRLGASAQERKNHTLAVDWLAKRLTDQKDLMPGQDAVLEAEKLLNKLYSKESRPEALGQIMGEKILEPLPEITPTDLTGAQIDTPQGILQTRKQIPKEIRLVMGEINDPGVRMVLTAVKQSEFINGLVALEDLFKLANEPGNRWVSKVPSGRFDYLIRGSELNPFSGYYTTEPIGNALNAALGSGLVGDAFQAGGEARQQAFNIYKNLILIPQTWTRGGKILYSPFTQTRNLVSGAGFAIVNSNFNLNNFGPALEQAGAYVKGLTPKQAKRLVDLGVMNTSPFIGDLARTYELAGRMDSVSGVIGLVQERQRTLTQPFKGQVGEFVRKTYQFGDDFWKVVNYLGEFDKYTEMFAMPSQLDSKSPEFSEMVEENIRTIEQLMERGDRRALPLNSSTPEGRLNEAIEELAAYRTRQNVPNYDFIGTFGEIVRIGPTGDFVAFPTEQVRTSWNTVTSGITEIQVGKKLQEQGKTELGKQIERRGWTRVMSYTLYNATIGVGAKGLALGLKGLKWGAYGALGMFAAGWGEDRNEIILDIDSRTGVVRTVDTSSTDAYDVITEPIRALIRGAVTGRSNWEKTSGAVTGFAEGLVNFFAQYFSPSIYAKAFTGALTGTDDRGRDIRDKNESLTKQGSDTLRYLYDQLQPGISTTARQFMQAEGEGAEQLDRFNREKTLEDVAKRGFGATVKEKNLPKEWASFKLTEYLKNVGKAVSDYRSPQYKGGSETLTVSDIIEAYNRANETYYNLVLQERKRINAAGDLSISAETMFGGIDSDRLKNISKRDRANLQLEDIGNEDGGFDDINFTPIEPKNFFDEAIEDAIAELARKGKRDERLERMEFPQEALDELEAVWGERILEGYNPPAVQSDVMIKALEYFGLAED